MIWRGLFALGVSMTADEISAAPESVSPTCLAETANGQRPHGPVS